MSLLSQLPVIDDRTYDDIVSEIRARIPSYTPEWVPNRWDDFNESDPGIMFAQLAAWLTEMQLYLKDLARVRRARGGDPECPIDIFLCGPDGGGPLDDELVGQHLILLLIGATDTFPKAASRGAAIAANEAT